MRQVSDREFIDLAAKGLKIEPEPFKPLADQLGLSVEEVIARIDKLIKEGKVRRFAASVRHQPMGYLHNAMVIARVQEENLEEAGEKIAALDAVSHCYQRPHPDGDPFCLYAMVHGTAAEQVETAIAQIRGIQGVKEIEVLRSQGELKKTSLSGVSTDLENLP